MKTFPFLALGILALAGCSSATTSTNPSTPVSDDGTRVSTITSIGNITQHFAADALVGPVETVDCTLSGGTETECYKFTITSAPRTETVGPWCPMNISDSADAGGKWLEDGEVYDVDGDFIKNLATFYSDENWQLFDALTGDINVTDTQVSCEGAAKPNVDEEYQNHCVKCEVSYFDASEQTYIVPITPVLSNDTAAVNARNGVAVSFNGVRFDGPAPVDAIKSAYTIAAFDDCGGHVNPAVGYHYHIATDCPDQVLTEDTSHAPIIGLALDGHTLHTQENADSTLPTDLDECNGHADDGVGYHYHAGDAGSNQILGCYKAEYGCVSDDPNSSCDASATAGGRPAGGPAGGERPAGGPPGRQ